MSSFCKVSPVPNLNANPIPVAPAAQPATQKRHGSLPAKSTSAPATSDPKSEQKDFAKVLADDEKPKEGGNLTVGSEKSVVAAAENGNATPSDWRPAELAESLNLLQKKISQDDLDNTDATIGVVLEPQTLPTESAETTVANELPKVVPATSKKKADLVKSELPNSELPKPELPNSELPNSELPIVGAPITPESQQPDTTQVSQATVAQATNPLVQSANPLVQAGSGTNSVETVSDKARRLAKTATGDEPMKSKLPTSQNTRSQDEFISGNGIDHVLREIGQPIDTKLAARTTELAGITSHDPQESAAALVASSTLPNWNETAHLLPITLQNVDATSTNNAASVTTYQPTPAVTQSVLSQVVDTFTMGPAEFQFSDRGESRQLSLQINPPELGRIEITIDSSNDMLKAHIIASESVTSHLLIREKTHLIQALQDQGIDLPDVDISYQDPRDSNSGSFAGSEQDSRRQRQNKFFTESQIIETQIPSMRSVVSAGRVDLVA